MKAVCKEQPLQEPKLAKALVPYLSLSLSLSDNIYTHLYITLGLYMSVFDSGTGELSINPLQASESAQISSHLLLRRSSHLWRGPSLSLSLCVCVYVCMCVSLSLSIYIYLFRSILAKTNPS